MGLQTIRSLTGCAALALFAVAAGLLAGCGEPAPHPSPSPAKVVARVNGSPLTSADLEHVKEVALLSGTALNEEQALRRLVGEELVRQEAERLGVSVTRAQIDERLDKVAAAAGGLKQLKSQLAAAGLGMVDLYAGVESVLFGERLAAVKYAALRATRAEARAFYDKNLESFSTPAAVRLGDLAVRREAMAQDVVDRIEAGQSFESAAHQFSADPELRSQSGMLGWVTLPSLPAPARAAIERLQVGEMTAPIQVGPLWHVFKLFGRRAGSRQPFADVAQPIAAELTRRLRSQALARWVERERETADIVLAGQGS